VAAFIRIVLAREPAFDVYVECPKPGPPRTNHSGHQAIIRVTRRPGNQVLAADLILREQEQSVVETAGCLIIHNVRQQPGALRNTPRWERWGEDIEGYSIYRRALDNERRGERDAALKGYDQALRHEPGNFLISIRKAALLEGVGKFEEASEVYRTCDELWPEHIETAYRLSASYANGGKHDDSEAVLKSITSRLKHWALWEERSKTWWPTRWNIGERHYWKAWTERHPPIVGPSNRDHLLVAVEVAEQVRGVGGIVHSRQEYKEDRKEEREERKRRDKRDRELLEKLLKRIAELTMRRVTTPPYKCLFHPELSMLHQAKGEKLEDHDDKWHNEYADESLVIYSYEVSRLPRRLRPRKRIGWLAHYNAACFYSLGLELDKECLPTGYEVETWKIDCARAAIRELGHVRRDPLSKIEPDWYRSDPELQPLRDYFQSTRWAKLVGL